MKKILIISANPKGTQSLRLDEELREIKAGIQRSLNRDQFSIECQLAARPRDIQRAMLDCQPHIVHFCGHGDGNAGLILEDDTGGARVVSTSALSNLFELFSEQVECVLLNACYSEIQAGAISQHIDNVIGMNQAVSDRAAIEFATSFYDAIGAGKSIQFAFRLGKNAIQLSGISEEDIPILISNKNLTSLDSVLDDIGNLSNLENKNRVRVFISYKRGVFPDESVALEIFTELSKDHQVFIDKTMLVGTPWAEKIESELRSSDFLITFLTPQSVNSEMVKGEIETAYHLKQLHGKPTILPVRLSYRDALSYPLSAYLNGINWATWEQASDTHKLIQELRQAINGFRALQENQRRGVETSTHLSLPKSDLEITQPLPAAQPIPLEMPEGTMDPNSHFYVERETDKIALDTIKLSGGVTITIKGPRQMGKSSLLIRTKEMAEKVGKQVAYLDFQLFDRLALMDGDQFYRQFCEWLTAELELESQVKKYWEQPLGNNQRCTQYVSRYLLKTLDCPIVLAMDEVESIFDTEFRSDFFGMLRSWHNNRAVKPIWKRIDLVLVTSTEPYQLIENLNQSPFNVGQIIELVDLTEEQIAHLNRQHGSPITLEQSSQLIDLLGGHPYLIRRALYLIASHQISFIELLSNGASDRGPFGDHLRYHLFRMNNSPELVRGLLEVIQRGRCSNESIFFRLRGAGLVRREGRDVLPRCQLYTTYFKGHLNEEK